MVTVTVDRQKVQVEKGSYILKAAEKLGIRIPTLCYHPCLEPYGACRVCLVETEKGGRKRMVTACNYPVDEGLVVRTSSESVIRTRKIILELLLARYSKAEKIRELAAEYGVRESRFGQGAEHCILCGLCVRVCENIIGARAISFVNRGIHREVAAPFHINSETCTGCGACAFVCPTAAIQVEDIAGIRELKNFHTGKEMARCLVCGSAIAPRAQITQLRKKLSLPEDIFTTCQKCKRAAYARKLAALARR